MAKDLVGAWDRWRRTTRVAGFILIAASSPALVTQAQASDGNFQSVLLEAGCPTAKIDKLSDRNGTTTYRANCFSTSHKIVILTCVKGVCAGGPATYDDREDRG